MVDALGTPSNLCSALRMNLSTQQNVMEKCEMLLRTDHYDHEDIIRFLQDAADPYAIPFLKQAVFLKPQLTYLEYDDYGAYYKKIFWALQSIGTMEAIETIREYTFSKDSVIEEQATYRLAKISKENGSCPYAKSE